MIKRIAASSPGGSDALGNVNIDVQAVGGVAVSPATNDAPIGTEFAQVIRDIFRKRQILLTTTPLAANGVFTSAWIDTELTGTMYVLFNALSNVTSSSCRIEESDDQLTPRTVGSQLAATNTRGAGVIRSRYYRIVYTNGATLQTTFSLFVVESSVPYGGDPFLLAANDKVSVAIGGNLAGTADAASNAVFVQTAGGNTGGSLPVFQFLFNGATWDRQRTPAIFKQVSTAATGSTALWTPTAGKKFRLLSYTIEVTANAAAAVAGVLVIQLLDAAGAIAQSHSVFIPSAAGAVIGVDDVISIDLGNGILSAAANNVLNLNLSFALTAGVVNVLARGTEE